MVKPLSRYAKDSLLHYAAGFSVALSAAAAALIFVFLFLESIPALQSIGLERFLFDSVWIPEAAAIDGEFGLQQMIVGSAAAVSGAVLLSLPIGLLAAVFLQFYAPVSLQNVFRRCVELLAGIPSVLFGLWGLVVLVPILQHIQPPGVSLLCGILVLSLMIVPTIVLICDSSIANAQSQSIATAEALGISRPTYILFIVFPLARSGILLAALLASARALGETIVVVMVCGNVAQFPNGPFDSVRTLTASIALEMGYAYGDHRSSLFFTGFLLLAVVTALLAAGSFVSRRSAYVS